MPLGCFLPLTFAHRKLCHNIEGTPGSANKQATPYRHANTTANRVARVDDIDEDFEASLEESLPNIFDSDNMALLPVNGIDLKEYLNNLESSLIKQALDDCNGVVARAAEKLRIRRTTLVEKMRKYEMLSVRKEA